MLPQLRKSSHKQIYGVLICDHFYRIPSCLEKRYQSPNLTPFIMICSAGTFSVCDANITSESDKCQIIRIQVQHKQTIKVGLTMINGNMKI